MRRSLRGMACPELVSESGPKINSLFELSTSNTEKQSEVLSSVLNVCNAHCRLDLTAEFNVVI